LGRYSACRRVARTIYLGSAPTLRGANRGIEDRRIKLGCVQPGETPAIFGDALRRLTDQATYLYVDGNNRYWISTQPNVTRTAQDRATQIQADPDKVWDEMIKRLRLDKQKGEFAGIHIAPDSSADIPDDSGMGVRLVVLHPQYPHTKKAADSQARQQVASILDHRGASPRYCKNLLIFLAADSTKIQELEKTVCQYLAWESIIKDERILNLDPFQKDQAEAKKKATNEDIDRLLHEAYQWLILPEQPDTQGAIEWKEILVQGQESAFLRTSRKLIHEEYLITHYSAERLRMEALDHLLWKDENHVDLRRVWDALAQYTYLPRLRDSQVLVEAIQAGASTLLWQENFAFATGWDEQKQHYLGLKAGPQETFTVTLSSQSLIIKPPVALAQMKAEDQKPLISVSPSKLNEPRGNYEPGTTTPLPVTPVAEKKHFFGTVSIDPMRLRSDGGKIADEVLQHFTSILGADVKVSIEIDVQLPEGASDNLVRTITENCRVLKFEGAGFEEH
jgi:hypothetical protein